MKIHHLVRRRRGFLPLSGDVKRYFQEKIIICISILLLGTSLAFSQKTNYMGEIGVFGIKLGQLNRPRDVGWDMSGNLYVADTGNNRIQVFDNKLQPLFSIEKDRGDDFKSIASISISPVGYIYVLDDKRCSISIFTSRGRFAGKFGKYGTGHGEFINPSSILIHNDFIYVCDSGNKRLQIFSLDGIFVDEIKAERFKIKNLKDMAVDPARNIYILDNKSNKIIKLDANYNFVLQFGKKGIKTHELQNPQGLAVDKYGYIYVADESPTHKIKKFDSDGNFKTGWGTFGRGYAQFQRLCKIRIDILTNKLFTVDDIGNKIQFFDISSDAKEMQFSPNELTIYQKTIKSIGCKDIFISEYEDIICLAENQKEINILDQNKNLQRKIPIDKILDIKKIISNNDDEIFLMTKHTIFKIDKNGIIENIGSKYLKEPQTIDIISNLLYVFDNFHKKIFVINNAGKLQNVIENNILFAGIKDTHVDNNNFIYVLSNQKISKFFKDNFSLFDIRLPSGDFFTFTLDSKGNIFAANENSILVVNQEGKEVFKLGKGGEDIHRDFQKIKNIYIRKNNLYIYDSRSKVIKTFKIAYSLRPPQKIIATGGAKEIKLNWDAIRDVHFYNIYRSETQYGNYQLIGMTYQNFYRDVPLPNNTTFFYRITSVNEDGWESESSQVFSAKTLKLIPSPPTDVAAYPRIKEIKLNWSPSVSDFVLYYKIYRSESVLGQYVEITKTRDTIYIDKGLQDEKTYYYKISAVGEDGENMLDRIVWATTLSPTQILPPLEIINVEVPNIFPANYKYYADNPTIKITLKNNTDKKFSAIKINVFVKDYLSSSVDKIIPDIPPQQMLDFSLPIPFNDKILEVTSNIQAILELRISYYINQEEKIETRNIPFLIYSKNSITWDDEEKIALFITPQDEIISKFTRGVIAQYDDMPSYVNSAIFNVRNIFNALSIYGIKYVEDPNNPYQEVSENKAKIDTVMFPRELLATKSGDCDDIVSLLASTLENIGIKTAMVDVPSHIFLIFNTEVNCDRWDEVGPEDNFICKDDTLWAPLETTLIGKSFFEAYMMGLLQYKKWEADKKIKIIDLHSAWKKYKPPSLPYFDISLNIPDKEEIEKAYSQDIDKIIDLKIEGSVWEYKINVENNPKDTFSLLQIGITYGENGRLSDAEIYFRKVLDIDPKSPDALCNLGNIYLLQANYETARQYYEKAYLFDPKDAYLLVNLATVNLFLGNREYAKNLFQQAKTRDKKIEDENKELDLLLKY